MAATTMIAVSAGRRLAIVDPSTYKQTSAPPSPSKQTALDVEFTALAWSHDNSALYVACDGAIRKYDAAGHFLKIVYSTTGRISSMVMKDNQTLIFAMDDTAYVLNCENGEVTTTFDGHTSEIMSMSLSRDYSLLATSSASECVVVDLGISNTTTLQGVSTDDSSTSVCVFHCHSRTRLVYCAGRAVHVFDVTKPSSPVKSVTLSSKVTDDIVAATCSPFSKSLAAVASTDGSVCLVDLDSEKGHFKSTDLKTDLTSLAFTADGAALLAGTATGQLLMLDLRSFKDEPKRMTINGEGKRVVGISVQRRVKKAATVTSQSVSPTPKQRVVSKASPKPIRPLATQDPNVKPDPAVRRVSAPTASVKSPVQLRVGKTAGTLNKIHGTPLRKASGKVGSTPLPNKGKRTVSSSLTSSMNGTENATEDDATERLKALSALVTKRKIAPSKPTTTTKSPSAKPDSVHSKVKASTEAGSSGASSTAGRTRKVSTTASSNASRTLASRATEHVSSTTKSSTANLRGQKVSSSKGTVPTPPITHLSTKERGRHGLLNPPRVRTISNSTSVSAALAARRRVGNQLGSDVSRVRSPTSRASSPDLDELSVVLPSPTTNLSEVLRAEAKKGYAKSKLGEEIVSAACASNEMNGWVGSDVEPSKADRKVDFDFDYENEGNESKIEDIDSDDDCEKNMEIQISPSRPANTSVQLTPLRRSSPHNAFHISGQGNINSPYGPMPFPSTPASAQKAQEFMRSLISSAMYDFQKETRAELMGMHLDMLRMGRDWKKELREVLSEAYDDELKELREENKRLREENERLRMGL